jgi:large subunit ribosomal protein L23
MHKQLALKPRISEKAYSLSEARNTYIFDVSSDDNKHSIATAVADQYKVGVVSVHIAAVPGKSKRSYRKRTRSYNSGRRSDIRKAYVTLKEGDKLPVFADVEPEAKKPAKEVK